MRPPEPLRDSDRLDDATDQNRATKRQPLPPCWSPARATPALPSPARLSAPGSIAPCDIMVLPFATQIHKSRTPIHDGPLKAEVTFCVQGVSGPPCGVPSSTGLTKPSSITPDLRNARMSLSTRLSVTRAATRAINNGRSTFRSGALIVLTQPSQPDVWSILLTFR